MWASHPLRGMALLPNNFTFASTCTWRARLTPRSSLSFSDSVSRGGTGSHPRTFGPSILLPFTRALLLQARPRGCLSPLWARAGACSSPLPVFVVLSLSCSLKGYFLSLARMEKTWRCVFCPICTKSLLLLRKIYSSQSLACSCRSKPDTFPHVCSASSPSAT